MILYEGFCLVEEDFVFHQDFFFQLKNTAKWKRGLRLSLSSLLTYMEC